MTPRFANAVDPVLLCVIDLMQRIDAGESPSPEESRRRIVKLFEEAEGRLGSDREWELAKYAIVSWIDEMMVDTTWSGRDWWSNNVLEVELFNSRLCNELFYDRAEEAAGLPGRDALEMFHDCVILGFRGFYRDPEYARTVAEAKELPLTLEEWLARAARGVRHDDRSEPLPTGRSLRGAPPMHSRATVVWTWLVVALLAAANGLLFLLVND